MTVLFWVAVLDSIWMLVTRHPYGLLNNKAADASFIACMLPMVFQKGLYKWKVIVSAILMVVAILFMKSSTGLAAVGVGVAALTFQTMRSKKRWLLCLIIVVGITSVVGFFVIGKTELLDPSGRQVVWREAWNLAIQAPWFGHGTGSFTDLGQVIQRINHPQQVWLWLHNEYLEVFFENGAIGLVFVGCLIGFLLRNLYRAHAIEFPIAVVYLFTAITEMPLRLFVTKVLGVCILCRAFKSAE